MTLATGPMAGEQVAAGALQIAVGSMANAVKRISVDRGYDVTRYTLQCFGGAAGQHACLVADALGIDARFHSSPRRACCPPTAWAWPTRSRCARRRLERELEPRGRSRPRASSRRGCWPRRAAELESQGVEPRRQRRVARCTSATKARTRRCRANCRLHGRAGSMPWRQIRRGFEATSLSPPLRLFDPRGRTGHRGGVGGMRRQR